MKIALVILHANPARGGAERYTLDLASSLTRSGHQVTLLAATFADVPPGVSTVQLSYQGLTRTAKYERFLDALDHHLDHTSYDIVHAMLPVRRCDVYHPHAGVAAQAVSARGTRAWLTTLFNPRRRRFARVERELLTGPNPPLVLCLSNYVKAAVRRHYPLPDDRLFRLFNSTDLTRFDPAASPTLVGQTFLSAGGADIPVCRGHSCPHLSTPADHRILALLIAQDFQRKGLRQALQALATLNDPRLVLLVVGRDSAAPYRRLAHQLNIADHVIFAGPTPDPRPFYVAADFFLLPTRHDPCSLVVLEALAMGLPVISTVQNGACEIMTDGQEGFILPNPTDVTALAGAMRQMLDPITRLRMRNACLALRPRLSQDEHLRRLMQAYPLARKK